jgi:cell division inhibitor SepF
MSVWQKTLLYLGLVDEDELEAEAAGRGALVPQQTAGQAVPSQAGPSRSNPGSSQAAPSIEPAPTAASQPRLRPAEPNRGPRRVEPPDLTRHRTTSRSKSKAGVVVRPGGYTGPTASHSEIIAAHSFSDAKRLADMIRERIPVVVNLRDTEPEMVRRLVDFSSGLIYALDGTMRKVAEGVILVNPPRITISPEEERRLADLGLFDAL